MSDLGVSFSPFNQPAAGKAQPVGAAGQPVQDAIKILSLRVPTTVGASSGAPQSLLGGPTALGSQLNSFAALGGGQAGQVGNIQEFLRRILLGNQGAPALGSNAAVSPFGTPDASIAPSTMQAGEPPQAATETGGLPVSINFGNPGTPQQQQPAIPPSQPPQGNVGLGQGRADAAEYLDRQTPY